MKFAKSSAALACAAALISCGNQPGAQRYGQVSVALTSTGSDGTTYRLPQGSSLSLEDDAIGFFLSQGLDGNQPEIDVSVPAGSYQASLEDANGNTPVQWALDKLDPGGNVVGSVQATLITAMPALIDVNAGQITPLVFAFTIPQGGVITFQHGTVAVTVTVTDAPATSFATEMTSALSVSSVSSGPSPIEHQLAQEFQGTSASVDIAGALSGGFAEQGGEEGDPLSTEMSVCAPLTITVRSASGSTPLMDLVAETAGADPTFVFGNAALCIFDFGTNSVAHLRISKLGAPITPTFSAVYSNPLLVRVQLEALLPNRPYDSSAGTLDLGMLMADTAGGLPFASGLGAVQNPVGSTPDLRLSIRFAAQGGVSFSFTGE